MTEKIDIHLCTFKTPPSGAVMSERGDADCTFEMCNSVNEIYKNALNDPSLLSTIDIRQIINTIDKTNLSYLENKTMEDVSLAIDEKLIEISINASTEIRKKLIGYRYVDEIHELHKGKHVRWIRHQSQIENLKLTNGGIIVDIRFLDNGTHILCMNAGKRFIQYKFDECVSFQKMTVDEQFILQVGGIF